MENYKFWIPEAQPDILGKKDSFGNIEWTSNQIIDNLYEKLRKKYPDYITRTTIGLDSSGKYEMYAYMFTPEKYTKTVYIQAGVHCLETEGYFGLARLMTLIADRYDSRLSALRDNVRFLVVPCVSVYGISIKGGYADIMSGKRYDIPNNVLGINPNRDFFDMKLCETRNIRAYLEEYISTIDIAFDFHTTTMPQWKAYLLPYPNGLCDDVRDKLIFVNNSLYEMNRPDSQQAFMGEEKDYPTGEIVGSFTGGLWSLFGIPGSTVEHSDYIFSDVLGTSQAMTRAVELYANHVLCQTGY